MVVRMIWSIPVNVTELLSTQQPPYTHRWPTHVCWAHHRVPGKDMALCTDGLHTLLRPQHHTRASSLCGCLFSPLFSPTSCAGSLSDRQPPRSTQTLIAITFLTMPQCDTLLNLTGPQHSMLSQCSAETASTSCLCSASLLVLPVDSYAFQSTQSFFWLNSWEMKWGKKGGERLYFLFNLF